MSNNKFHSMRVGSKLLFTKSLLLSLLMVNVPFSLQASEKAKPGLITCLGTGLAVYFGTKASALRNENQPGEVPARPQSKRLALSLSSKSKVDRQGKKLVNLYIANYKLSKVFSEQFATEGVATQQFSLKLDLPDLVRDSSNGGFSQLASFGFTKAFGKTSTIKKLVTSFLLLSSITGVGAGQIEGRELMVAGPGSCAICVAGCCAALGQLEGPICVLHCSSGPCALWCLAPIP